jgi:uncharacterized damage-inducible protein DinB
MFPSCPLGQLQDSKPPKSLAMLRRTKGLLLLTLLVITGLAGTITDGTLSKKERKSASTLMKSSRSDLFNAVKGLSEEQLNYKTAPDRWSIKECVYHIAISERNLWGVLESTMKNAPNPEKRSAIKKTDEEWIAATEDRSNKVKTAPDFEPKNTPYNSLEEALFDFKSTRANHIKYIKTSTEDMRNHVAILPFATLDCYQLSLLVAAHTNRHKQQIEEVKADPNFPK